MGYGTCCVLMAAALVVALGMADSPLRSSAGSTPLAH